MEKVKLLRLQATRKGDTVLVEELVDALLPCDEGSKNPSVRDLLVQLLAGQLPAVVPVLAVRQDLGVHEVPDGPAESVVRLPVVGRELPPRPHRLGVRHRGLGRAAPPLRLQLRDRADAEPRVPPLLQHGRPVEAEEELGRVLAGDRRVHQGRDAARMQRGKAREVVHDPVNDYPEVALLVVPRNLLQREGARCCCRWRGRSSGRSRCTSHRALRTNAARW
mmetsp:Transcript_42585/g.121387  ORF Transcript_42585/g.121387 Transcript_42585/m.121387 type:complete len:221 (+) Transcript_42585:1087-1749(+)